MLFNNFYNFILIKTKILFFNKYQSKHTQHFIHQLSELLNANIALSACLDLMTSQEKKLFIKQQYQYLQQKISQGMRFSSALQQSKFNIHLADLQLIAFAEESGQFTKVMQGLAEEIQQRKQLKQQFKKSLSYPVFVFVISSLISLGLLIYLIPMFADIFKQYQASLPFYTKLLLNLSQFFIRHGLKLFFTLMLLIFCIILFIKSHAKGAYYRDYLILHLPGIGKIKQYILLKQLCSLLTLCHQAGMTMNRSLDLISRACTNNYFQQCLVHASLQVKLGKKLSKILQAYRWIPHLMLQSLAIAEETAALEKQLTYLSQHFKLKLDESVLWLSQLSEPVMIILIGLMMGGITLAMYLPLFHLGNIIS